eukprot:CAMPEP_0185184554 /NCGR_PEP_ID=MMETSP1140-20130426/2647_1 /TAXON_ID=298111 /ORGANISM="Pavlova sp., Strain CCMP459" /LENGTH=446 /DNA_ID=CAMNT_0027750633 /DNA_START=17 /DNA_END=1357 /DNA_ORIENTATION=-
MAIALALTTAMALAGDARAFHSDGGAHSNVWVIGDVHADAGCARAWVRATGLVRNLEGPSTQWAWEDESTALVFMGDYIDKGPESVEVLTFMRDLSLAFPEHVFAILGNHELNLLVDRTRGANAYKYLQLVWGAAHPGQYRSWLARAGEEHASEDEATALAALYEALGRVYERGQFRNVLLSPNGEDSRSIVNWVRPEVREVTSRELARWQETYLSGMGSDSPLGAWVEARPVAVVLARTLFVHGGVRRSHVTGPGAPLSSTQAFAHLNAELAANVRAERLPAFLARRPETQDLVEYRGLHSDCGEVHEVVRALNISRIAVGHTPAQDVRASCDGAFLALDSSLGRWFRTAGNSYCEGSRDQLADNGQLVCPRRAQGCEGRISRLEQITAGKSNDEESASWAWTPVSFPPHAAAPETGGAVGAAHPRGNGGGNVDAADDPEAHVEL